jgi:eukaryotic-like serine/threonine-protein kinase
MKAGETLSGRYEIVRELGRGGAGVTCLARDSLTGKDVVVKVLHLSLMGDWKAMELFKREAGVLKGLHHEGIPAYVDFFSLDRDGEPRLVLVREFIEGASLHQKVQEGWRGTEEQIRAMGARLARIVSYIHGVRPPVIHRDINPRNIIVDPSGDLFLVDFGGVQDAIRLSTGATDTIVGTPGYTPMEQFTGRASIRSDLYALAATILFLLTHRNPADLPVKDMKIDVPSIVEITSPGLARLLGNWLEPDEGRRTIGIDEAIALLAGAEPIPPEAAAQAASDEVAEIPPHGSRIVRTAGDGAVSFSLPEAGGTGRRRGIAPFGLFWLVFIGFWTSTSIRGHAPLELTLTSLPFWVVGLGMVAWVIAGVMGRLKLEISPAGFAYARRRFFFSRRREVPLRDVGECRLVESRGARFDRYRAQRHGYGYWYRSGGRHPMDAGSGQRLLIDIGAATLSFGEGLSAREQEWLRDSINAELKKARHT